TPTADYNGPDSFTYTVTDTGDPAGTPGNVLTSNPATVSITVTPVNDPPTADSKSASTAEDTPVGIALTGSDVETTASSLTITLPSPPGPGPSPSNGTPVAQGHQSTGSPTGLAYPPAANYNGPDSSPYTVPDTGAPAGTPGNALTSAPATVTLTVTPV